MKSLGMLVCLFAGTSVSLNAYSTDLVPQLTGGTLDVRIINIALPPDLVDKELNSGLPNEINTIVELQRNGQRVTRHINRVTIRYDLWDEIYRVSKEDRFSEQREDIMVKPHEMAEWLTVIRIGRVADATHLDMHAQYTLKARIIFNPIQEERIRKIRDWAIDAHAGEPASPSAGAAPARPAAPPRGKGPGQDGISVLRRGGGTQAGRAGDLNTRPRFKKLFDKILEQYLSTDEFAAEWKSELMRTTFTPGDLKVESQ